VRGVDIITIFTPLMGAKDMDVVAMRIITYKGILIGLVVAICLLKDRPRKFYKKHEPEETPACMSSMGPREIKFTKRGVELEGFGYEVYADNIVRIADFFEEAEAILDDDPRVKVHSKEGIRVARPGDAVVMARSGGVYVARDGEYK
jgi:hypothetical protein